MKYIISENKLNKVGSSWMNQNFSSDELEIVKSEEYPDSIFFKKNGKVVMEQNKKNMNFWFDYDNIWSFFESFFGMKYEKIQEVLNYWLEETFKLEGYTPLFDDIRFMERLEETFKLEGYTPEAGEPLFSGVLEETLKLEGYTPYILQHTHPKLLEETYNLMDKYLTSQLGDAKLSNWFHNEEEYTNKYGSMIIFLDKVHEGYTQIGISEDIYDSFGSMFSLDNDDIQRHLLKWFKDHMEINNAEEIEVFQ